MSARAPSGAAPRRARWRGLRLLRWLLFGAIAAALLLVALLAWLLYSGGGRDLALGRVLAALPPDSLSWRSAEGALAGPLVLHGVRYRHGDVEVTLERVEIDFAPAALFSRTLWIERLSLESGVVTLAPASAEPTPWPAEIVLPESLPELRLPLAVRVDAAMLRDIRIAQGEIDLLHLQRLDANGRFERGRLALQRLDIDSDLGSVRARGDLDTAARWDSAMQVDVTLASSQAPPLPVAIELRGDLQDLTLSAVAALAQPARLHLRIVGGLAQPRWTLALDAPQIDAARLGQEGEPLTLELQATGTLREVVLSSGRIAQGARELRIEPSTLRYADGTFALAPLAVGIEDGRIVAEGEVDLRGAEPAVALALEWADLTLPGAAGEDTVQASGTARVDGVLSDFALEADGVMRRTGESAAVTLRGRGSSAHLDLAALDVRTARGGLEGAGRIVWSPRLEWSLDARLADFDPAYFAAGFDGAVDASLRTRGGRDERGLYGELQLDSLGGELRGRALGGRIDATLAPDGSGSGTLALRIGESRLAGEGSWSDRIDVRLTLAPLQLTDIDPVAGGSLQGTLRLRGSRSAPSLSAQIEAQALAFGGHAADALSLVAEIEEADRGTIRIDGSGLVLATQRFDTFSLAASGTRAQHELGVELAGGIADVDLMLVGGEGDGRWLGELRRLRLVPRERDAWVLRAPAQLAWNSDGGVLRLAESCLDAAPATLCAAVDWNETGGEARFTLDQLQLAQLDPFLTDAFGAPISAYGTLSAEGRATRDTVGVVRAELNMQSPQGGLRTDPRSPRELLVYRRLRLEAGLDAGNARLRAEAALAEGGTLLVELDTDSVEAENGALRGRIEARVLDLTFIELLSDQIVEPAGQVDATLMIGGTRATPSLAGSAALSQFEGELPALGLALSEGRIALQSRGSAAADIAGSVVSGDGTLTLDGHFDLAAGAEQRLVLDVRGANVRAAAIPELAATISPDIQLSLAGDLLRVRGKVAVPAARIELERLQSATSPSPDVVIVDEASPGARSGIRVDSDVSVELGDDVRLNGFGLKGKLSGRIAVRDRPGRATVARGGIEVGGEYKAYGQDLRITRGRLAFASTPIDNPALDIRAEREVDDVTVGVQVRGTALAPELTLWSDPALDQAEQLSYLVLGRPLRSASQADGAQLSQAAAAFGGNYLAQRLGARMGLDEVEVADSRALGGAALTVGKFLSPKLYVSYGVALFGSGQVVTFKYLLSRVWSVQIDSSTENRAALNYRLER